MEENQLTKRYVVAESQTALAMGSGDMEVLATPALVCMMENTAMELASSRLGEGETTVGGSVSVSHVRPSAVGAAIEVSAELKSVEGRRLEFAVRATEGGNVVGEGTHVRFVVSRDRFLSKLK